MYLRHEAGHAFNYAYKLYETRVARALRPVQPALPRSLSAGPLPSRLRASHGGLVRPEASGRGLRRDVRGLAHAPLGGVSATRVGPPWPSCATSTAWLARLGDVEPVVRLASTDITVEEMNMTVEEFFRAQEPESPPVDVALEHDLADLFVRRRKDLRPAADFVREHRAGLINKIEYWTGVRRSVVRALVDRMVETTDRLRPRGARRRGGGHARRADHVCDHAHHELPHLRQLRAPGPPASPPRPAGPRAAAMKIVVAHAADETVDPPGAGGPARKTDVQEVAHVLRAAGHDVGGIAVDGTPECLRALMQLKADLDLQPRRVVRRRQLQGAARCRVLRDARATLHRLGPPRAHSRHGQGGGQEDPGLSQRRQSEVRRLLARAASTGTRTTSSSRSS